MSETIVIRKAQVETLTGQVESLKAEVNELKTRLNQNSRNGNKPPSTDCIYQTQEPAPKKRPENRRSERPPGSRHTLKMVANPDRVIIHRNQHCQGCGLALEKQSPVKVKKRQVFDIPLPKTIVTEPVSETICYPDCGLTYKCAFPPEVTQPIQYGKNLIAQIIYINQYQLLPYGRIVEYLKDIYNLKISEATIFNAIKTTYETLGPVKKEIISLLHP
jgi:transposase